MIMRRFIIEMTNILKAQGLYAEAIEIYQQALMLNIIKTGFFIFIFKQFSSTILFKHFKNYFNKLQSAKITIQGN